MSTQETAKGYWNPYFAGIVLGLVLFSSFILSGEGLGASGGVTRFVAAVMDQVAPTYVDRNPYMAGLAGGSQKPLDNRMVWMVLGAVAGGFVSGWLARRLKFETFKGPQISTRARWCFAFLGGAFMGYGAAVARGCTSGQALSGGAVLGLGSWVFMMMVFAGAYLLAYPLRKLWN